MLKDALRLAVRWAIKRYGARVVAFACIPTHKEFRTLVQRVMDATTTPTPPQQGSDGHRNTLH